MSGPCSLRWLVPLACVLSWSSAAWAANPHLQRAKQELDELRYDDAASSLEQALRVGENGPKELGEIYQLSGQTAAARGDAAAAEDFFRHLLALAPQTTLPAGVSPKIAEPFAAARSFIDQRLPIACRWESDPSGPALLLLVDADPLSMVHGAEVVYQEKGKDKRVTRRGTAPYSMRVPRAAKLSVRIAALDEFGNRLVEFGQGPDRLVLDTTSGGSDGGDGVKPPIPKTDEKPGRPIYAKWWLWGGVALVTAGVGTYFGLDVIAARDEIEDLNQRSLEGEEVQFSDALAIQQRGDRSALVANVTFGVAGAAAAAAVILLVTEPGDERGKRDRARLVPSVGRGHVGVAWTKSF